MSNWEKTSGHGRSRTSDCLILKSTPEAVTTIRSATNGNYALGNMRFIQQIEEHLGRRAHRGKAGRPANAVIEADARQESLI